MKNSETRLCRRCDQPESRHVKVDGVGHVCPRAVSTFDPQPEDLWNLYTFITPTGIVITVHEKTKITIHSRVGLDAGVWLHQVAREWDAVVTGETER